MTREEDKLPGFVKFTMLTKISPKIKLEIEDTAAATICNKF